MGRFDRVVLDPGQRLRLAAKVRALPTTFDGQSHPFVLSAQPLNDSTLSTVDHPSVFFVPRR
jgi:hypothetical protein